MNKFLEKLHNGQFAIGSHISFCDSTITEAIASAGFDYVWIDTEHTAMSLQDVQQHIIAAKSEECASIVRIAWNDPIQAKHVLEMGPDGIIFPQVNSYEEAVAAVASCRYPPLGNRGFGPRRAVMYGLRETNDYIAHVNDELAVILQIENINAVKNLDRILTVDGITAFVIGPCDLAASMGHITDPFHEDCLAVEKAVIEKVSGKHIPIGMSMGGMSTEQMRFWKEAGLGFISLEGDSQFIANGAASLAKKMKVLQ